MATALQDRFESIPRRPFGRTGETVSALGLGGFHLGEIGIEREATSIVHRAIDAGITFMDNAWEYNDGVSETRMGKALANGWRQKVFLMTKVCTHGRDAKTAMRMLEESLRRLKTDYLDLWQVHEVAYWGDPERHFAKGGVIEALDRAKAKGLVRFVGFTGHKDPALHLERPHRLESASDAEILAQHARRVDAGDGDGHREAHGIAQRVFGLHDALLHRVPFTAEGLHADRGDPLSLALR